MITLLSSIVALYAIPALYKRLSKFDGSTPRMPKIFFIAIALFIILAFMGSFMSEEAVDGRGTSTAILFIALPLVYLFVTPRLSKLVIGHIARIKYIGIFLAIMLLLYPLDLTVGYDAGRNLGEHMLSVLGFYIGLSIAIAYFYTRYAYSARTSFVVGGIMGVLVEQNFLGPILLVSNPIGFLIFAPTIFLTYSMYLLTPCLLLDEKLRELDRKPVTLNQKVVLFVAATILPILLWFLVNALLSTFGIAVNVLSG